jgi:hypothetical protein
MHPENKFEVQLNTTNECFVGNLNKQKTRDEIFQDLTSIKIKTLDENLYISKFNMPKFNARKDQNGNLLLNLGYAFVTTKKPEMARWLIEQKRIKLDDGSDIEIKPISKTKRLQANQNCKVKNITKLNGNDDVHTERISDYKSMGKLKHGTIGDGRGEKHMKFNNSRENMFNNYSDNWSNNHGYNLTDNMYGNFSGMDSVGNSVNNSINNTGNSYTDVFSNSAPIFKNQTTNSGSSLFDFDKNFAPAALDYNKKSESSNNIWPSYGSQENNDRNLFNTTGQNNNSIFNLVKQKSKTEDFTKPELLSATDSNESSPTNPDHSYFRAH